MMEPRLLPLGLLQSHTLSLSAILNFQFSILNFLQEKAVGDCPAKN
jgi:hypothetical protein